MVIAGGRSSLPPVEVIILSFRLCVVKVPNRAAAKQYHCRQAHRAVPRQAFDKSLYIALGAMQFGRQFGPYKYIVIHREIISAIILPDNHTL